MIIIGCSGAKDIAERTAKKIRCKHSALSLEKFPDNEIKVTIDAKVKDQDVVLIQSFYDNINDKLIETVMAMHTAKEIGARRVMLFAPYFPYLREDKRFHEGESVSARIMAKMFKGLDYVFVIDPHLHRFRRFAQYFDNAYNVSSVGEIASYVRENIRDPIIIGPDWESYQWAEKVANLVGTEATVLHKDRFSAEKVKVDTSSLELKGKNVVIVDDIISTGHTMMEVVKTAKQQGARGAYCIGVHGIFVKNSLAEMLQTANVVSTNTIPSQVSRIDIVPLITRTLKNLELYDQKKKVAEKAAEYVKEGMTIGLGSGTTMEEFVKAVWRKGKKINALTTSDQIRLVAEAHGIRVLENNKRNMKKMSLAVDGTDQYDSSSNLLKGQGALAFKEEKEIDYNAGRCIIICDKTKKSRKLNREVLVEIGEKSEMQEMKIKIEELGGKIIKKVMNGKRKILYVDFGNIKRPKELEKKINNIDGVIENGIFANFKTKPMIITP